MSHPTRKRALLTLLLIVSLAFPLGSVTAHAAGPLLTRTLTVLQAGNNVITQAGLSRGRGMERESLGISLAAGAVLEARVSNAVADVRLQVATDDAPRDTNFLLPTNGTWAQVTVGHPGALFARTRQWATAPQIEYRVVSGTSYDTPEYRLGDSHTNFMAKWDANGSPTAVIIDRAAVILVPTTDKERVRNMASWSGFANLDAVIEFYRDLIDTYDAWAGIDDASPLAHQRQLPHTYFVRPDASGGGLAYYASGQAVGTNINSVHYYLQGPTAWVTLHEVGHGYDNFMSSGRDATDISLGEVWNNVYGYHYQVKRMGYSDWLYGQNKPGSQKASDDRRAAAGGTHSFNALGYGDKLDFVVRIAELTGIEGWKAFTARSRDLHVEGKAWNTRRNDLIVEEWGAPNGYNLIPWLAAYNLPVSTDVATRVADLGDNSIALSLADYFPTYADAQAAATTLSLGSPGSLIGTSQVRTLPNRQNLRIRATIGDSAELEGRLVTLWDGSEKVAEAPFFGGLATFTGLPLGAYTVRYPAAATSGTIPARSHVVVRNTTNDAGVTYDAAPEMANVGGALFTLHGLGDNAFASIAVNHGLGTVHVRDNLNAPHSYFSDEYAHITVCDAASTVLYDRSFIGNQSRTAPADVELDLPLGSTITVRHREQGSRFLAKEPLMGTASTTLKSTTETTVYVRTEFGLAKQGATAEQTLATYKATLDAALNRMQGILAAHPTAILSSEAVSLKTALDRLPAAERADLEATYGAMIQAQLDLAAAKAGPVGGPVPSGSVVLDRTGWTATASSAHSTSPASALLDGNPATIWHNDWTGTNNFPYTIGIDLGGDRAFHGFSYLPRQDKEWDGSALLNGRVDRFEVLAGSSAQDAVVVSSGTYAWSGTSDQGVKYVALPEPVTASYVAYRILDARSGAKPWASGAEFTLYGKPLREQLATAIAEVEALDKFAWSDETLAEANAAAAEGEALLADANSSNAALQASVTRVNAALDALAPRAPLGGAVPAGATALSKSGWTATANSAHSTNPASAFIDGNGNTIWHNDWNSTTNVNFPFTVSVDLGGAKAFDGFSYLTRQDGSTNGRVKRYELLAGTSAADAVVVSHGDLAWASGTDKAIKYVALPSGVTASYVAFRVLDANSGSRAWASGAELTLYQGQ
ncbi:hypothetical protein GCM10025789_17030 [Tessaracoccus lubricantis]|uniref:Peptidase M60 domain-containing protein n=1 Tax=Tessaracoccus lubricantis TaxID=545543 RepID=A0ABP9FJP4_9ACTN